MRSLRFSVAVDDVVAVGCEVAVVRLVDFGAMVLELYFPFGDCFVWSWVVCSNWCFLGVCWGWLRVLGEVGDVHVLNILIGIDIKDFINNFCDGVRFLK